MLKIVASFWLAFKETVTEYLQTASLNGFTLLYHMRRHKYQRFFWSLFLLAAVICACYVTMVSVSDILRSPTVVTLETNQYLVEKVPFPAVSICSVNKLSRSAVNAFIEDIRDQFDPQLTTELWLQKIKLLAGIFDSGSVDFKEAAEFQKNFLNKQKYNITELLKKLAPNCDDLILKCHWAGKMQECSELFVKSLTANGYCCTFNYFRPDSGNETLAKIKYPNDVGTPAELTLLLNTSKKDYFLTDRSFIGYTFQIFNFADFPDASNGGSVREAFIPPGSDIELRMSASVQTATSELGVFNVKQRLCFLYGEALNGGNVRYSSDECMTHCKISGVLRLCGCIPYYSPADLIKADNSNITHCTLAHLECLERKKFILHTYSLYWPFGDGNVSNQALDCRNCVPLCNFNTYTLHKLIGSLRENYLLPMNTRFLKMIQNDQPSDTNFEYSYENLVSLIRKSEDVSLVKLYFDSMYATQYSKRSLYTWYEMLSNIGGVIGIFIGCSLISAFEVFYIFGLKLIAKFRKHYKVKSGQNSQSKNQL